MSRTHVDWLEEENRRLREELARAERGVRLHGALLQTGAFQSYSSRRLGSSLLEQIVLTAASVMRASAAALFLLDDETDELVFEIVHGGGGGSLRGTRLPAGKGIAGYAAMTGQVIAVNEVEKDPRWARDVRSVVDYKPRCILCAPMIHDESVIGILEILDKNDGKTFTAEDIDIATHFANLAARTIDQSRISASLESILRQQLGDGPDASASGSVTSALQEVEDSAEFKESVALASKIGRIACSGSETRDLCQRIIDALHVHVDRLDGRR